ncbi:FtsX-like permease family protein [Priestia taiwanensis]|uniref:ABC transporter permease n=1 Tax=Priestia taiwanensis TaxID=1347902 RepID=A0A917AT87_9BACI|nr:ABC transporter permease [Priestia taiwanensis]MBM7364053.1 putative ABC transport system permease protein [Priestia taiwanensis]GGE71235.1 ABC transporter permease [Priestia taiwanensis]
MTFSQLAWTNIRSSKRKYAAYFVSSAFVMMVYFVYSFFAFHPAFAQSEIGEYVTIGMRFAQSIIYVFSFFFILYSMGAFLKARKKEFGILTMVGASHTQLRKLVFLENMMIGTLASIGGIAVGITVSWLLLLFGSHVISMDEPLAFYVPITAIWTTFLSFFILFFIISIYKVIAIKNSNLLELLKGTRKPKPEPKASTWKAWLAAFCLFVGYVVALLVKGAFVIAAMIPVTIIVCIGTYLLFTQLSVYIITKLKQKQTFFWKGTTLISLSDLAYRMKDNARMFFFVAIISTVAFSAIGTLVGLISGSYKQLDASYPFDFKYASSVQNEKEAEHQALIERMLGEERLPYEKFTITYATEQDENGRATAVIPVSTYEKFADWAGEEKVSVTGNEAVFFMEPTHLWLANKQTERTLANETFAIQDTKASSKIVSLSPASEMVVSDEAYEHVSKERRTNVTIYEIAREEDLQAIGETLTKAIGEQEQEKYTFEAREYVMATAKQGGGVILFVGLFIGVVFFVAAGSFLYFRLYADVEDDRRQFDRLKKMGLIQEELSRVITTRLALLFFVPIIIATLHGYVALTSMQNIFGYNLWKERIIVLGSFVLFQCVYFFFVRKSYLRHVEEGLRN